jgi:pimeloyl-ACP methyl ester carboxylesterase
MNAIATTATEPKTLTAEDFHASRQFVDTDFGRIAWVERGEGPLALFVHGALLNGYQWRHQLAGLADIRRVVAVDSLAMGYTEMRPGQALGMKQQAAMLAAFLDALGVDPAARIDLVGNDSGGGTAQVFAATYPERIRTLTLTNCEVNDYDDQTPGFVQFRHLLESGGLPGLLRAGLEDPRAAKAALATAYQRPEALPDDAIDVYFRPLVSSEERIRQIYGYVSATSKDDLLAVEERLRSLPAPVVVLWGTADDFFPVSGAHWLRDHLTNVEEVVEIEGAPVFWPEERPELVNQKLRDFWGRHPPAR